MPVSDKSDQFGHFFWPSWLLKAYVSVCGRPQLHGSAAGPVTLLPVQRVRPQHRRDLRLALEKAGAPWDAILEEAELRLVIDFEQVLATAVGSSELRSWALDAVCASAPYLSRGDAVLEALLRRRAAGVYSGVMEDRLLDEHVGRLLSEPARIERWAAAVRRAVDPLIRRSDQFVPPRAEVVVDLGRLSTGPLRARCKVPVYPKATKKQGEGAIAAEARWLLSCNSVRDGARRDGGVIVVNLPAYLSVSRMLGRGVLCSDRFVLPEQGAPREEWFSAGTAFGNVLAEVTKGHWVSRHHPAARAAQMRWQLDPSVPLLALNAEAVELTAGGRGAAIPDVAIKTPTRRGHHAVLELSYGGRPIMVTRRYVPHLENRLYFELPFTPPDSLERRPFHRVHCRGRELWCQRDINALADAGWSGARSFAEFVRNQVSALDGDGFRLELSKRTAFQRAADVENGVTSRMGPFTSYEREYISASLVQRKPGTLPKGFWDLLCADLPGRTAAGVKRCGVRILKEQAARLGAVAFKQSAWWPGPLLGEPILRQIPRRRNA